jgi:hypothetical protein
MDMLSAIATDSAYRRPRFTEREGRLLLAAVYAKQQSEPEDEEWRDLLAKLTRTWGDNLWRPLP